MRHFQKRIHRKIDVELAGIVHVAQPHGLVRNAGPEGDEAVGADRQGAAIEHVVHGARGQPVELDMAMAVRLGHDLGRKRPDAEAAEGFSGRIETAVRPRCRPRRLFPPARGRARPLDNSHTFPMVLRKPELVTIIPDCFALRKG